MTPTLLFTLLKGYDQHAETLKALLAALDAGEIIAVTNELTLAEALVKSLRHQNDSASTAYRKNYLRRFIYVTTAHLTHDQLHQLSEKVGEDRTLLVLCTAFRARADQFPNLTIKKIPRAVLSRCEWDHDDYSLRVENLPKATPEAGQQELFADRKEAE